MGICTRIYQINKASVCASVMILFRAWIPCKSVWTPDPARKLGKVSLHSAQRLSCRSLYGNGYELDHFEQKNWLHWTTEIIPDATRPDQKMRIHYTVPARLFLQEVL
jgi:hypothetical protein